MVNRSPMAQDSIMKTFVLILAVAIATTVSTHAEALAPAPAHGSSSCLSTVNAFVASLVVFSIDSQTLKVSESSGHEPNSKNL